MARATFRAKADLTTQAFAEEPPPWVISPITHPYVEHSAAMLVFNKAGSGKVVRIAAVEIDHLASTENVALLSPWRATASIITGAPTGGETVAPVAMDSASPAPAFTVWRNPVVTAGTGLFRFEASPSSATASFVDMPVSQRRHAMGRRGELTTCQPLTLASGQCLIFAADGVGVPHQMEFLATLMDASNRTWEVRADVVPRVSGALLAISATAEIRVVGYGFNRSLPVQGFNGVVSPYLATTAVAGSYAAEHRLEYVESTDEGGDAVSVVPMDSADVLPAGIRCARGDNCKSRGASSGAFALLPSFLRSAGNMVPFSMTGTNRDARRRGRHPFYPGASADLWPVLREGQGLAVMLRGQSYFGEVDAAITFTVEDAATAGGPQLVARAFT